MAWSASFGLGTCGTTGTGQQIRLCIKLWTAFLREPISSQCRSPQRLALGEPFKDLDKVLQKRCMK